MTRVRVLICDDAVMYATMLAHWFAGDPDLDIVATAGDRDEALHQAGDLKPDVILLDHLFSGQDSAAMAPQLRERVPGTRIVLVSGLARDALARAAAAIGAESFVTKASGQKAIRDALLGVVAGDPGERPCSV